MHLFKGAYSTRISHQLQLKQTFDLWGRTGRTDPPVSSGCGPFADWHACVYLLCLSRMHYGSLQGSHLWPRQNLPHKMLQAYKSIGSLQVPAYQVVLSQILSHLIWKWGEPRVSRYLNVSADLWSHAETYTWEANALPFSYLTSKTNPSGIALFEKRFNK